MSLEDTTNKVTELANETDPLGSTVKFVFEEGVIFLDGNENNAVSEEDREADCTISMDLADFNGMLSGDLDPTSAFMGGQMQIDGDMMVAMKLTDLFN